MNANQIINTLKQQTENFYATDDVMRWPFLVGCMEVKIRELIFAYNNTLEEITRLQQELLRLEK